MKRIGLLLLLLSCIWALAAQAIVSKIVVNSENSIVSRVVITLSQKSDWSYDNDTANRLITVTIDNTNATAAVISGLAGNNLISGIETARGGVIHINLKDKFFIETMTMDSPYRIILDLFVAKAYTFQDYYQQASFYDNVGKLASSAREYNKMLKKYPDSKDTHYFYAKLLVKQNNKAKAKQHFAEVPPTSRFYKDAQARLAVLEGKVAPKPEVSTPPVKAATNKPPMARPPVPQPTKPIIMDNSTSAKTTGKTNNTKGKDPLLKEMEDAIAMAESSAYNDIARIDTVYDDTSTASGKVLNTAAKSAPSESILDKIRVVPLWTWFIILLILLIFVFIILDSMNLKRPRRRRNEDPESLLNLDDSTKCKMVSKLLADGWDAREIARELRMSRNDVNTYIKHCQSSSYNDEDN